MYVHKFNLKVRYSEVDRMNIVYHANYINWFEIGRTEFFRSLGYTYRELEEQRMWLPVIDVGCKYKSPVTYDDTVTIETFIEELGRVRIKYGYRVLCGDRIVVEGYTSHGFTDDRLKPIRLNKVRPDVYEKLLECTK